MCVQIKKLKKQLKDLKAQVAKSKNEVALNGTSAKFPPKWIMQMYRRCLEALTREAVVQVESSFPRPNQFFPAPKTAEDDEAISTMLVALKAAGGVTAQSCLEFEAKRAKSEAAKSKSKAAQAKSKAAKAPQAPGPAQRPAIQYVRVPTPVQPTIQYVRVPVYEDDADTQPGGDDLEDDDDFGPYSSDQY